MRYLFFILPVFLLTACDLMKPPTHAETVWFNALARWEAANTYERYCVKPEKMDVNMMGNVQMIVASLAGELGKRVEGKSDKFKMQFVDGMIKRHIDPVHDKLDKLFLEKGCSGPEATETKPLYELFTKNHPSQIHGLIYKEAQTGNTKD